MITKQQIQSIKQNSERSINGLRTQSQEFVYELTGGFVKENTFIQRTIPMIKEKHI